MGASLGDAVARGDGGDDAESADGDATAEDSPMGAAALPRETDVTNGANEGAASGAAGVDAPSAEAYRRGGARGGHVDGQATAG